MEIKRIPKSTKGDYGEKRLNVVYVSSDGTSFAKVIQLEPLQLMVTKPKTNRILNAKDIEKENWTKL